MRLPRLLLMTLVASMMLPLASCEKEEPATTDQTENKEPEKEEGKEPEKEPETPADTTTTPTPTTPTLGKNEVFVVNGDFNININEINGGWKRKQLHNSAYSTFEWVKDDGVDNSGCVKVTIPTNNGKASSGFSRTLTGLTPNKMYRMRAQVKSENVANGRGAVIFDMSTRQYWNSSKHVLGTNNWQEVFCDFYSDDNGNAEIVCALGYRLGGTSSGGYSTGTAWFDNIRVEKITADDYCYYESNHFILYTDKGKADLENIKKKAVYLDNAYKALAQLTGMSPYKGRKIAITGTHGLEKGYWALAGNPILLGYDSNAGVINNGNEITFGLIHEIGHDFNAGGNFEGLGTTSKWNWNDELFANFRAYYGVMMADAPCSYGKMYKGETLKNFYKSDSGSNYDIYFGAGKATASGNPFTYIFIRLGDEIGWDAFKVGFNDIYKNGKGPFLNNWTKFDYMITTFQKYTSIDIRTEVFPAGELDLIKQGLGGN